ncbi:MAG: YfiR family protein [Bacteroidales bacterium]|nr:YfiR family protein [Bacteroidales bacterium]
MVAPMLILMSGSLQAQSKEYLVKAVLIEKFTKYTTWPKAHVNKQKEFTIGVYGDNPFGNALNQLFINQQVHNMPVKIVRAKSFKDLSDCQLILYCQKQT